MPEAPVVGKLALEFRLIRIGQPALIARLADLNGPLHRVSLRPCQRGAQSAQLINERIVQQQFDLARRLWIDRAFVRALEQQLTS